MLLMLKVCIKKLKRGKSPGIDGVTAAMVIVGVTYCMMAC